MNIIELAKTRAMSGGSSGSGGGDPLDLCIEGGQAEVNLPNVTKIKKYGFYQDSSLINITMPNVTSIGQYAFQNCSNLALTKLPSGITSIGSYAFSGCSKLALTELPSGITIIDSSVFYSCTNLAIKEIPSGVTRIEGSAFYNCKGLTEITFKSKPSSINNSFSVCTNIKTINVPWAEGEVSGAPWGATNATINYNYTGG